MTRPVRRPPLTDADGPELSGLRWWELSALAERGRITWADVKRVLNNRGHGEYDHLGDPGQKRRHE